MSVNLKSFRLASENEFNDLIARDLLEKNINYDCHEVQYDYTSPNGNVLAIHEIVACADFYFVKK
jgi:hypothetical protein